MNAKRMVLAAVAAGLVVVGSAGTSRAQFGMGALGGGGNGLGGFGGFGNSSGFNALGGTTQFGSAAFANPGFGIGGYGAVPSYNAMGFGYSPSPLYGGSPTGFYGGSPYGYGYRNYNYGYSPYGYRAYGAVPPSTIYYTPPPVMYNRTNALMRTIQGTTGRGSWRLRRR